MTTAEPAAAAELDAAPEPAVEPAAQPKPTETVEFWKQKARENEKRAKDNAAAALRLSALEESQKTELQKAQDRADAAERNFLELQTAAQQRDAEAETAKQIKTWTDAAAAKFGVPADVIRGTTEEELQAHAKSLKALIPDPRHGAYVPGEGRGTGGGVPDPATEFADLIRGKLTRQS